MTDLSPIPRRSGASDDAIVDALAVFDAMPDAVLAFDRERCCRYANRAALHLIGRDRYGLDGRELRHIFPDHEHAGIEQAIRAALMLGRTSTFTLRCRQGDFAGCAISEPDGFVLQLREVSPVDGYSEPNAAATSAGIGLFRESTKITRGEKFPSSDSSYSA